MAGYRIFIVEDDPWYGEILEFHLGLNPDYEVHRFESGAECLKNLYLNPDLITIDYVLSDMLGKDLLTQLKQWNPLVPVIVISGQEEINVALNLLKSGAYDYLTKDDNTKELLWNTVVKARETHTLREEVETLKEQLEERYAFEKSIIGQSQAMGRMFKLMEKAVRTNINVSVIGETGTGKEVVAKAIHFNSDRRKKPFVPVNMAAIPGELVESELFGHEKGAFTGAIARKAGKFEEAQGGTIFLDEIAELDLPLQSKLLRVLQEREVCRVGGNEAVKLNVRLIVATHKNLQEEVRQGRFREDLYYRIIGMPIELPPLRERGNDILLLARYFMDQFIRENKLPKLRISEDARDKLMNYNFPGNVRELKAMIELAAVMCDGDTITADDISYTSVKGAETFMAEEKTLRAYNRDIIRHFLRKYDNDVMRVANKLDIGKSTIYKMLQDGEIVI